MSDTELSYAQQSPSREAALPAHDSKPQFDVDNADALAALTFLEQDDETPAPSQQRKSSLPPTPTPPAVPEVVQLAPSSAGTSGLADSQIRSSFAPSKQAAERKAKTQAQQAAHQAAVNRPGKANGRGRTQQRDRGAWNDSSDEEEDEEDEEDDDDADSDGEPRTSRAAGSRADQDSASGSVAHSAIARGEYQTAGGVSPARSAVGVSPSAYPSGPGSAPRPPRDLPQVPGQRLNGEKFGASVQVFDVMSDTVLAGEQEDYLAPQPRRLVSDQYSEAGRRSVYPDGARRGVSPQPHIRPPPEHAYGPPRQSIWTQVLESGKPDPTNNNARDTFVQIEPPSQTMTKAFAPHGLLSAGLQDKQDRSAKRQEELARETGASLINVPNKPPPPQTGLLGAVSAHERERKREGGLGAALTEREREKRVAEERQRKLDDYQRQQLDQMQQGGGMFGGMGMPQFGGYNPMMANPMMMGMNPMMAGGWGYPGMMPGLSPQHMFAAQQAAAQAYQQAMMAFSVAGSQVGGDHGGPSPLNPMMTGGSMGMGGMDPRLSMMSMPMMNSGMGMNPGMHGGISPMNTGMGGGMNPSMGMGMGMNPMGMGMGMGMGGSVGPQMTGSGFDSRVSPGIEGNSQGLGDLTNHGQRPSPAQNSPMGTESGEEHRNP